MKRMTSKFLSWLLSVSLMLSLCAPTTMAAQKQYRDTQGHWAEDAIDRWSDYGIISGYDGAFNPDGNITRAQMAAILSNTLGLTETADNPFGDVPADAWYTPFVLRCYAAGVMAGDGVNANPDALITREAAMTMICNAFGIAPAEDADLSAFTDGGMVSNWAAPFVAALVKSGIVGGIGDGLLAPTGSMTRASVVTVVDNTVVQYINAPGTYELTSKDGLILVASGDVTLTGKTAADILVTSAADGKSLIFDKAEISGAMTVQADNTAVTSKDSKLPEITMTGVGSSVTEKDTLKEVKPSTGGGSYEGGYTPPSPSAPSNLSITENNQSVTPGTYQNVTVTAAVGDGEVTLKDLTIHGDLTIQGGGSNSIKLENCTIGGKVIMAKESGEAPRLHLTNTPVVNVEIQKPAIIEAADASSPVTNVDAKAAVEVKGEKTQVETLTAQANVSISSGNIYKIEVPQNAPSLVHVSVASEANLEELEVNAPASIASQGTVSGVTARADVTVTDGQVDRVTVPENTAPVHIKVDETATISDVTVNTSGVTIDNDGTVAAVSTDLDTQPQVEKKGNNKDEVSDADHKHNWGSKWTYYDNDYHHKKCSTGDHIWTKLHNWNKKVVSKEPTAFEEGEMTYTCSTCDGTKKETIPASLTSEDKELIRKAEELGLLTYLELSELDKINRLEMAKLLGGYLDCDMSLDIEQEFTDCQNLTELERKLIAMACKSGMMAGYDDGSFKPDHPITRAEMAVILAKLLHGSDVDPSQFADYKFFTDVPAWASGYVNLCAALSLLEPTQSTSNKFYPNDTLDGITAFQWILNIYLSGNNWPPAEGYVWVESSSRTPQPYCELWMNARVMREIQGSWRLFTDAIGYTVRNAPADFSSASDREVTEWIDTDQDGAPDMSNIQGRIFKAYCRVPTFGVQSLSYVEQTYEPGRKFTIYNGQSEVVDATVDDTSFRVDKDTVFVDVQNERSFTGCETVPNLTNVELAYVLKDNSVADIVFILDAPNPVAYIAQFGMRIKTAPTNLQNQYVYTSLAYFDDGTYGVYEVDVDNSNGIDFSAEPTQDEVDQLNGIGTELYKADGGMKGLYEVHVLDNGKLEIDRLTIDAADTAPDVFDEGVRLVRGHSTLLDVNDNLIQTNDGIRLCSTNKTKFFYVSGAYQEDSLEVHVINGVKNIYPVTNVAPGADDPTITGKDTATADDPSDNIGTGIRQVFYTIRVGDSNITRAINSAMLIQGVSSDVYYYNAGDYKVEQVDLGYVLTYTIYSNQTGDMYEVTYNNGGKYYATADEAKTAAECNGDGFYTIGMSNLKPKLVEDDITHNNSGLTGTYGNQVCYLVNDTAIYDNNSDSLRTAMSTIYFNNDDTKVVDLTNNGLSSIAEIVNAVENQSKVLLSYSHDEKYNTSVLFVSAYDPAPTNAPNDGAQDTSIYSVTLDAAGTTTVTLNGNIAEDKNYTATLYAYSVDQATWVLAESKTLTVAASSNNATVNFDISLVSGERYKVIVEGTESNVIVAP